MVDTNGSSLILAADDEEDMTRWMQALCLATIGEEEVLIIIIINEIAVVDLTLSRRLNPLFKKAELIVLCY